MDYLSGKYINPKISKIFGVSNPSVKRLARRLGLPKKYSDEYPPRAERIRQSIELYKKGWGCIMIARQLGIDDETVRGYLHKRGIRMRGINGFTKNKVTRQNKIIKELYPKGVIMKEIEKKVGLKHHGIILRLRKMGIEPNRRDYTPIGDKYDKDIRRLFLQGKSLTGIGKKLRITIPSVKYRIVNKIFPNYDFKLKWKSKLTGKWKTAKRAYKTCMELKNGKTKLKRYAEKFKVVPIISLNRGWKEDE